MKKLFIILSLFLLILNTAVAGDIKTTKKEYKVTSQDGFFINSVLEYPKNSSREYSTVVLLHSLGYNSQWWGTLPKDLLNNGYAVLMIDLRGHGTSVYNSKMIRTSWQSMTNKAYSKYPNDVYTVIDTIKNDNKKVFFDKWAIVGSDLGAVTGIFLANKIQYKPQTIVMISPVVKAKGLYAPIKLAELNNIDILSITGSRDITGKNSEDYIKKFAQSTFVSYESTSKLTGMLMFKSDDTLSQVIVEWINQYLK